MRRIFVIGHHSDRISRLEALSLEKYLRQHKLICEVRSPENGNTGHSIAEPGTMRDDFKSMVIYEWLRKNRIDMALCPMETIPVEWDSDFVIAALSERRSPEVRLIVHHDAVEVTRPLKLKADSQLMSSERIYCTQVESLFPDSKCKSGIQSQFLLDRLLQKDVQGILVHAYETAGLEVRLEHFQDFTFHPSECTPAAGAGVTAVVCRRGDTETRKVLSGFHYAETALCTNVERSVLKLFDPAERQCVAVHVQYSPNGIYNAYAACISHNSGPLKRYKISQNTYVNLAETIFENLTK